MKGLEKEYFKWLYDRVEVEYGRQTRNTYKDLLRQLHSKEFVWVVPNDDNRIADGMDLRATFLSENGFEDPDPFSLDVGAVTVLEVIVGLSERLEFISDLPAKIWAWRLIENLELHRYADPVSPRDQEAIDDALEALIWRTYRPDGYGGLFPLAFPNENQLKVEIWYQMHHFLEEQIPE